MDEAWIGFIATIVVASLVVLSVLDRGVQRQRAERPVTHKFTDGRMMRQRFAPPAVSVGRGSAAHLVRRRKRPATNRSVRAGGRVR
jgi:hypothetical protein